MWGLILKVLKLIFSLASKNIAFKPLHPWLLKLDAWCEKKLGIDIIKQEKKFHQKWPRISKRIAVLERDSHPPICLKEFDCYHDLVKRIEKLEKK